MLKLCDDILKGYDNRYCSVIETHMDLCLYLSRMPWDLERDDCFMIQKKCFPRDYWKDLMETEHCIIS